MFNKIIKASLLVLLGCLIGVTITEYKDKKLKEELAFAKEANAYKYECLIAADMYITANEHLLELIEDDPNICFADTYGELDCVDSINIAYAKLDSLYAQEL